MDAKTMTAAELIDRYGIRDGEDISAQHAGEVYVQNVAMVKRDDASDAITQAKQSIIDELAARKAAKADAKATRKAKLDAMEGLKELKTARFNEIRWQDEFAANMDDEDRSSHGPGFELVSSASVAEKYPRAAAYLKAIGWTRSSHDVKYSAGQKAADAILDGADYVQAIAEMEATWSDHCMQHIND